MSVREEDQSSALPKGSGKRMDKQAASLMKPVRFTIDERPHIEHDSNKNEEDHREECASRLDGLIVRGAEVLATADEVQRSLRIFSQRFRPTDFYETDRTLVRRMVGVNFQQLPFGRCDAKQKSHSC
jgi:hypothetical protein